MLVLAIIGVTSAFAVSGPFNQNGKEYYVVNSADPTEDTGAEVCAKVGKVCNGYTDTTSAVCKQVHPSASTSSGLSGDASGVFCNGAPQNGVCASQTNSCHTCPTCSNSIDCKTPIGSLYNEMYVECVAPTQQNSCRLSVQVKNTQELLNQLSGINQQIQACPQTIPKGSNVVFANGETHVEISMNNGQKRNVFVTVSNNKITGVKTSSVTPCKQKVTVSETDLDSVFQSSDPMKQVTFLLGQKRIVVSGCTFISRVKFTFLNPFARFSARRAVSAPPPPPPPPNCGQVGEQCNNRGCFSGVCATQNTRIPGQPSQWSCIDVREFDSKCVGRGNSPPAFACITGICR